MVRNAADLPTIKRQEILKRCYFFECTCPRCNPISAYPYPPKAYDEFFFKYLKCPQGPGLLRINISSLINITQSKNLIDSQQSNSMATKENKDTLSDATKLEERICNLCGYIRVAPSAPSIVEWCKNWIDTSLSQNEGTTLNRLSKSQRKRMKRKQRKQEQQAQPRQVEQKVILTTQKNQKQNLSETNQELDYENNFTNLFQSMCFDQQPSTASSKNHD
jgi:hypothetical protein